MVPSFFFSLMHSHTPHSRVAHAAWLGWSVETRDCVSLAQSPSGALKGSPRVAGMCWSRAQADGNAPRGRRRRAVRWRGRDNAPIQRTGRDARRQAAGNPCFRAHEAPGVRGQRWGARWGAAATVAASQTVGQVLASRRAQVSSRRLPGLVPRAAIGRSAPAHMAGLRNGRRHTGGGSATATRTRGTKQRTAICYATLEAMARGWRGQFWRQALPPCRRVVLPLCPPVRSGRTRIQHAEGEGGTRCIPGASTRYRVAPESRSASLCPRRYLIGHGKGP